MSITQVAMVLVFFAVLVMFAGCGDSGGSSGSPDTVPPVLSFSSVVTTVSSGGTIELSASASEGAMPSVSCDRGTLDGTRLTVPVVLEQTTITCTAVASDASNNQGMATLTLTVTPMLLADFFPKQVDVFGVRVMATANTPDVKVLHAASVMAEYLDNDEDGTPDNQAVVDILVERRAALIMANSEDELPDEAQLGVQNPDALQAQFGEETIPNGRARGQFDVSLEEVLHLITHVGFSNWNDDVFGERAGSLIADAMDSARGGQFFEIPNPYPDTAWYTYDDETCDYSCMVTEYTYWALTSLLGAQDFPGRLADIQDEWTLNTASLVSLEDPRAASILTDESYMLPARLPNGVYSGGTLNLENASGRASAEALLASAAAALPGHKIAFGDERRILMMNPDGTGVEELFDSGASAAYVSWGPEAEFVYFASSRGEAGAAWEAWRVNPLTKEATQLTEFGRDVRSVAVSPDGRYIAISIMTGNSNVTEDLTQFHTDLFITEMTAAEQIWQQGRRLALSDMRVLVSSPAADQFWYEELNWNPVPPTSGEEPVLAYTQTWRYDEDDVSYTHAFTIKADGTDQTLVNENSDLPIWDFSGSRLLYLDLSYFDFNYDEVRSVRVTGISEEVSGPAVSPDGQFVIFEVGDENRKGGMAYFSREGDNPGVLFPAANIYEPKWSPRPLN